MLERILVTGFPHTGTTVMRKIIGRSDGVVDEERELMAVNPSNYEIEKNDDVRAIVHKWPFAFDLNLNYEEDQKIVFIIRNPYYVFSSLNNRMGYGLRKKHLIDDYAKVSDLFVTELPNKNIFKVRYEDLFDNDYEKIREMFKFLGLNYSSDVIEFKSKHEEKPDEVDHIRFRNWQIRQKFQCMNDPKRINLLPEQIKKISEIETVPELGYSLP